MLICELISSNNTPRRLLCGSKAVISFSRFLGGSLLGPQTARVIEDVELNQLVRSLLYSLPQLEFEHEGGEQPEFATTQFSQHHHAVSGGLARFFPSTHPIHLHPGDLNLEPGISIIAERAQSLTGATGAAISLFGKGVW